MSVIMGAELQALAAENLAAVSSGFVTIVGGTFQMGSDNGDDSERPVHEATLSTFQMGIDDFTNDEYKRYDDWLGDRRFVLIGAHPATGVERVLALGSSEDEVRSAVDKISVIQLFPDAGDILASGGMRAFADSLMSVKIEDHNPPRGFDRPLQPAVCKTWFEAFACAYLHGCMLPTEWQYEYAVRVVQGSNEQREYATRSGRLTKEEAHYGADATADVNDPRYRALENGLRQMAGNVMQWMQNWYGIYSKRAVTNPTGPVNGMYKSLHGASWNNDFPLGLRAASRGNYVLNYRRSSFGFRLVAAPQASKK